MRGSADRKKILSRGGPRERARRALIARAARPARRNDGEFGKSDGQKSAEEGFFRRVTGRNTTPRRAARSRSRAGTYVAGGAGLHVLHLECWLRVVEVWEGGSTSEPWTCERGMNFTRPSAGFCDKAPSSHDAARSSRDDTRFITDFKPFNLYVY